MKTITMDFETYESEIKKEHSLGAAMGAGEIVSFITSGKTFNEYYTEGLTFIPRYKWKKVLEVLGRSEEFEEK
jgi:hypothetical protein